MQCGAVSRSALDLVRSGLAYRIAVGDVEVQKNGIERLGRSERANLLIHMADDRLRNALPFVTARAVMAFSRMMSYE